MLSGIDMIIHYIFLKMQNDDYFKSNSMPLPKYEDRGLSVCRTKMGDVRAKKYVGC